MQIGIVGLGRMGAGMARRLMKQGHDCVAYDIQPAAVESLRAAGATGADSLPAMVALLKKPRAIWIMVPAALVDGELESLAASLEPGDIIIDGGNSYYRDDIRRAATLSTKALHYVDVGTSGGIAGEERGYCLMIGGESAIVEHLGPVFQALAPGVASASRTRGHDQTPTAAEHGYLHCGPHGAGHFVKMIHNGIEYGLMAAYAEGFNILHNANAGQQARSVDAETTPLRDPQFYQYDFDLPQIAEVWRRGSVIGSWLLDLTAAAFRNDAQLSNYSGHVADSGEGRWTLLAAIDESVPTPVLSAALHERFASRGQADFANQILSAMRHAFGGHIEKVPE